MDAEKQKMLYDQISAIARRHQVQKLDANSELAREIKRDGVVIYEKI